MPDSFGRSRSRSRSADRRRSPPQRYSREREDRDRGSRQDGQWAHDRYDARDTRDRGKGGKGGDDRRHENTGRQSKPDWVCSQCNTQNFARRVQCFKCTSPKTDSCILLNGGMSTANRGLNELTSAIPTAVLLVQHIGRESTELIVADALRIYAPVKAVKIVDDPQSYGSRNIAAVVEFHTIESSSHVMNMATTNQLKVGGDVVELSFAKATAPHIAVAWAAQAAAAKSREPMDKHPSDHRYQRDPRDEDRRHGGGGRGHYGGGGGGHYGGDYGDSYERPRDRGRDRDRDRDRDDRSRRVVVPPKWPPSFEEDGAVWTFDPTSGYFVHRPTEMFYEPKSKWYSKRDEAGVFGYYYHAPGYDPPFILMPAATTTTSAATSAVTATTTTGATVAVASTPQQPVPVAIDNPAIAQPVSLGVTEPKPSVKEQKPPKPQKNKVEVGSLRISMKKSSLDINKWNDRMNAEEKEEKDLKPMKKNVPISHDVVEDENSLLMKLGLDYSTLGCLRVLPVGYTKGDSGGPLCEAAGDQWACLLSRRCFPSEALLAKHIRLSKLYREELTKAIDDKRIVRLSSS